MLTKLVRLDRRTYGNGPPVKFTTRRAGESGDESKAWMLYSWEFAPLNPLHPASF
jgi:hypothetical protein